MRRRRAGQGVALAHRRGAIYIGADNIPPIKLARLDAGLFFLRCDRIAGRMRNGAIAWRHVRPLYAAPLLASAPPARRFDRPAAEFQAALEHRPTTQTKVIRPAAAGNKLPAT